jgi:hypothetical protein
MSNAGIPPQPRSLLDHQRQLATAIDGMSAPEKRNVLQLLENSLNNEKRERSRKHQHIETEVSHSSRAEKGIIENISPVGAFLSAGQLHPPGSEITLRFPILNFEFPVKLKAEVIWISQRGMGLRFKSTHKLDDRLAAQKLADALGSGRMES